MKVFKKAISLLLCAIMMLTVLPMGSISAEATTTKTKADAIKWLEANEDKTTFGDGNCVYLIYYYCAYLGFSHSGPNACDYTSYSIPSDWSRVKGGTPQKGDIIIYAGNGGYGHVAVYENDTSTWHQNIDGKTCVTNVSYNYKNIKAADGSGYWGYIRPDFEDGGATDSPKVTVDTSSDKYSITNTNAVLCGNIYNPFGAKVSKCGIKLYNENGTLLKDFSNSISFTDSNVKIWFDLNNEVGYTLTRGTKYKYVLYGVVDGKTYSTSTQTFTTKGGYTLSYNANGGTGAPSSQNSLIKYTISSTTPTRNGYTFLGWSTSSSASSASYSAGDSITISSNTTLYAVWKEVPVYNCYELVYDANGGSGAPESLIFEENETIYISEEIPARFGYVFEGWVSEDGFWYYPGQEAMFFEATVLYASWGNYKLSADESIVLEITDESQEVFVEFSPEESGAYAFRSFYTQDNLDTIGVLYDANGAELVSDDDSGDGNNFMFYYTVYAGETYYIKVSSFNSAEGTFGFEIVPVYYVTYNANGGQILLGDSALEEVSDVLTTVPYIEVVRDGYTFVGWSENRTAQYATYTESDELYLDGNTTLYAVWKKNDSPVNPEPDLPGFLTIRTPSVTKIDYGDSIVLHADFGNSVLTGLKVTWEASNDNFEIVSVSEDGRKCVITPKKSGDTTFTASVKIGTSAFGADTQVMTSKAGFFNKLIAFFKGIFGLTKTYPE